MGEQKIKEEFNKLLKQVKVLQETLKEAEERVEKTKSKCGQNNSNGWSSMFIDPFGANATVERFFEAVDKITKK